MQKLVAKLKGDSGIWIVILFLSLFSLALVYSATSNIAFRKRDGNTEYYLLQHAFMMLTGFFVMFLTYSLNYNYYKGISRLLLYISYPLLLYTLLFGEEVNDAARWIVIPFINKTFQTSDLAKLALVMYVARFLSKRQVEIGDFRKTFVPVMAHMALICGLIAPENFSTAAVLFSTCFAILFIGRIPFKYLSMVAGAGILFLGLLAGLAFTLPDSALQKLGRLKTWKSRIETFAEGGDEKSTHQSKQAQIAVARGGTFGVRPGQSVQKNFLPNPFSDFIYAIILEEYGLFGGLVIMVLYLLLLQRSIRIVTKSPAAFGALLAFALALMLVLQAFINMAVAVGLFPVTGLALPLVSMGGTGIWMTCASFGIILSVSKGVEEETQEENLNPGLTPAHKA